MESSVLKKNEAMKKIIYTLFVMLGLSSISFAQEANEIATTTSKTELANSKRDGVYQFTFVGQTTAGIEKSAKYYENYFSIDFDESSNVATITMKVNEAKSRTVITRFLIAAGAHYVKVGGEMMSTNEFMIDYLK
ncbi:MAG: capsule polysaccharide export protein KpsE/RkpR [Crocinitomicaceae bacterium]